MTRHTARKVKASLPVITRRRSRGGETPPQLRQQQGDEFLTLVVVRRFFVLGQMADDIKLVQGLVWRESKAWVLRRFPLVLGAPCPEDAEKIAGGAVLAKLRRPELGRLASTVVQFLMNRFGHGPVARRCIADFGRVHGDGAGPAADEEHSDDAVGP